MQSSQAGVWRTCAERLRLRALPLSGNEADSRSVPAEHALVTDHSAA